MLQQQLNLIIIIFFLLTSFSFATENITLGTSNGKKINPLMGINVGPIAAGEDPDNKDLTSQYQNLGINYIRNHDYYGPLDMTTLYPDTSADPSLSSSYQFTESDSVFQALLDSGANPYFRLGNSYNNSTVPENFNHWVQAAVEVIRHYKQMAENNGKSLKYVEIWNEPGNNTFWQDDIEHFYDLFSQTYTALKAEFPELSIGGSGFTPAGYLTTKGQKVVQGLLDYLKTQGIQPDFLSWHMYSNDPAIYAETARFYRELLDNMGYQTTESHITEWNTDFHSPVTDNINLRTGIYGASILAAAWIALQQQQVDVSTFYRGTDPNINAPFFFGIYDAYGNPKPIANNFSLFGKMVNYPEQVSISSDNSDSQLWLLAAKKEEQYAILIVNPTDSPISYTLIDNNNQSYSIEQLNSDGSAIESIPFSSTMSIQAYGTQLLTSLSSNSANFSATANLHGNLLDLTGYITPKANHIGQNTQLYAAALYQNTWFTLVSSGNWLAWDGQSEITAFQSQTLAEQNSINLIQNLPVNGLEGVAIYLGYGNNISELLDGQYGLIYTIGKNK